MASAIDTTWLDERITKTKALIVAVEDAILALSSGAISYTIDTGQTKQTVTKAQIASLRIQLGELESRLETLDARRNGGPCYVKPGW